MKQKPTYNSFSEFPTPTDQDLWLAYSADETIFKIWSPQAQAVRLNLYDNGTEGKPNSVNELSPKEDGIWSIHIHGDINGTYYTYQVQIEGVWLEETPGIYAQAVGVNGQRAMVLDMSTTNPDGWDQDKGTTLSSPNEAIIYELQIRDMTIHPESGSQYPGKYLGLVEPGTKGPDNISTGLDHIKELGITHVHLLPTYDHYSIDETKLDSPQFNWGYDPQNYNVPEGSFSANPFEAEVRIKEFKQMVQSFHDNGIGVVLDVVYNHTGRTEGSNFNLEAPGYYYRQWEDGKYSDASACGNETSSDREMTRKFIIESVVHWAKEYHLDGFRFDLMAIHDVTTMNAITKALKKVNPNIIIYGEGWTASDSPLAEENRALKKHTYQMPQISAFSDDIRDGIKGSVFDEKSTGFVNGATDTEESIKFGIVGAINHPQVNYKKINYSDTAWASAPWQSVSYVSCHDNHTLYDKLKISQPDASEEELIAMDKLANAIVMTSQGVAFIHAGAEILRTKNGEHNSYNLSDEINQIDWSWKVENQNVMTYYQNLIALRKAHPAFRMTTTDEVVRNLAFGKVVPGLISYQITHHANGDDWDNITVIYNANATDANYTLKGEWQVAVLGDTFDQSGSQTVSKRLKVPARTMAVLFQR